jgi:hypothetical protein
MPATRPQRHSLGSFRPFPAPTLANPFQTLERRAPRLSGILRQLSKRQDVRRLRAQIMLSILRLRCPLVGRPGATWYVPGAVARLGVKGLRRLWSSLWREDPPSLKSFRRHVAALVNACCLVVSPGDWIPTRWTAPAEFRPRHPDTIHVVDTDAQAEWLGGPARFLELQTPEARTNPGAWQKTLGRWRETPPVQTLLFAPSLLERRSSEGGGHKLGTRKALDDGQAQAGVPAQVAAAELEQLLTRRRPASAHEIQRSLFEAGVFLRGPNRSELLRDPVRLLGAVAMLARALRRVDPPRARAGFLVFAFRRASPGERDGALRILGGGA